MTDKATPKKTAPKKAETKDPPTPSVRETWEKSGGCQAVNETNALLRAICDKVELE